MIISALAFAMSVVIGSPIQGIPPQGGQGGFGGPPQGGPGMFGPMGGQELKILKKFDLNKDGMLDAKERPEARKYLKEQRANGPQNGFGGPPQGGFGGPPQGGGQGEFRGGPPGGGPGGFGGRGMPEATPGPKIPEDSVKPFPGKSLYDSNTLRTIFIKFENDDWEAELADFHNTDVDVPATVVVDGVSHKNVGVRFRGASSYMMVPAGHKRSMNLSVDMVDEKQRILGYKTLNLLNSNTDTSFMSSILYSTMARKYIPAPKANYAKVVINGESWGIYINVEQFNNDFVKENFKESQVEGKTGARWKVSGSPQADGGLGYLGDNFAPYKQRYEMKSKENDADWKALINLCKVLNTTPADQLEAALRPIFDIDGALKFLALDIATMNSDGYWIRSSDYSIYRDPKGIFHVFPHDMNEAFRAEGGPGGRGGRGGFGGPPPGGDQQGGFGGPPTGGQGGFGGPPQGGPGGNQQVNANPFELDPLTGLQDARKPLRSKLLAVPSLRKKYLEYVQEIARKEFDWSSIGPVIESNRKLIDAEIRADTRKNSTYEAFVAATNPLSQNTGQNQPRMQVLRNFFDLRRAYLLKYKDTQGGQ